MREISEVRFRCVGHMCQEVTELYMHRFLELERIVSSNPGKFYLTDEKTELKMI